MTQALLIHTAGMQVYEQSCAVAHFNAVKLDEEDGKVSASRHTCSVCSQ